MKKTLLTLLIALLGYYSYAKTYNKYADVSMNFTQTDIG